MFKYMTACCGFFLGAALMLSTASAQETPREQRAPYMWEEPSHQALLESDSAVVVRVNLVAGLTTQYHYHDKPVVYVAVSGARVQDQKLDQPWSEPVEFAAAAGETTYRADYVAAPFNHRVRNLDEQRSLVLVAVVSKVPLDATPSGKLDAQTAANPSANPWFKIQPLALEAEAASATLRLEWDAVVIQPGAGDVHLESGATRYGHMSRPGTFAFVPAGQPFRVRGDDRSPVRLVLVEILGSADGTIAN